jgi:hypothetical protein
MDDKQDNRLFSFLQFHCRGFNNRCMSVEVILPWLHGEASGDDASLVSLLLGARVLDVNPFCIDNIDVLGGSTDNGPGAILVHFCQFIMTSNCMVPVHLGVLNVGRIWIGIHSIHSEDCMNRIVDRR